MDAVTEYLRSAGPSTFFAINAAVSAFALIPGGASGICVAAGAMYGLFMGTLLYVTSSTTGALLAFALARSAARPLIVRAMKGAEKRLKALDAAMDTEGLKIVVLLRLAPVTPFVACNFLLGLTAVDTATFAVGTLLGLIPSSFVYVYFGSVGAQAVGGEENSIAGLLLQSCGLVATVLVTHRIMKVAQRTLSAVVRDD